MESILDLVNSSHGQLTVNKIFGIPGLFLIKFLEVYSHPDEFSFFWSTTEGLVFEFLSVHVQDPRSLMNRQKWKEDPMFCLVLTKFKKENISFDIRHSLFPFFVNSPSEQDSRIELGQMLTKGNKKNGMMSKRNYYF